MHAFGPPIIMRRLTTSRGKDTAVAAMPAMAPQAMIIWGGISSDLVACMHQGHGSCQAGMLQELQGTACFIFQKIVHQT